MAGILKRLAGPVEMSATLTTSVYNPAANTFAEMNHIHVVNKTAGVVTFSLWIGATGANAAGTEFFNAQGVAANSVYDWYGRLRMDVADFLVGGASVATSLTIEIEGQLYAL